MDTRDIAMILYGMASDMDRSDYAETEERTINDLEYALFYLQTAAGNHMNHNGYKTLFECLEMIAEHNA